LHPHRRPNWWPTVRTPEGPIETAPAEILSQVEELWTRQNNNNSDWLDGDWVLAEASGLVHQGSTVYDLEISGIFQKCLGPNLPDLEEVAAWYRGEQDENDNQVKARYPSPLRLRGGIIYVPLNESIQKFSDWIVVPASGQTTSYGTVPRWQYWRMYRHVWLPAPYLSEYPIMFQRGDNTIVIRDLEDTIGLWSDWTDGIGESMVAPLPPATGQHLLLKRSIIQKFAADTDSVFCWVYRLTGYYRDHSYKAYEKFTDCRAFGASSVVRIQR
jgi:hypothetical protein